MGCARTGSRWRWPDRVIPYTINEEDFPPDPLGAPPSPERMAIAAAINVWTTNTLMKIQERNGELHWIEFVAADEGGACSSHVGVRQGWAGAQQIPCNPTGGNPPGSTLVHEIGHAVGLWHEHTREDRNDWITVQLENVRSDKRFNYDQHVDDGSDLGTYDYESVMHYRERTFAIDWRPAVGLLGQFSKEAPAIAAVGTELHLVHLGESSNDLWHSWTDDGASWTANIKIPNQKSKSPPALAEWNGQLHMVHLGDSSNDIWWSIYDGTSWNKADGTPGNERIPGQQSKAAPALAAFGNELHMVHLGDSSNDIWHSWTSDGSEWTEMKIPGQKSKASPALASFGGQLHIPWELHMVHLGDTSNQLWHSWTDDGRTWPDEKRIKDQKSQAAPALSEFAGSGAGPSSKLHLAHIGDASTTIWHSVFDGADWTPNDRDDNNRTRRSPALAAFNPEPRVERRRARPAGAFNAELHSVHLGRSSQRLWHTVRDTSLLAIVAPEGVQLDEQGLSPGDISAVSKMYD
jgi:Astacin (Peptidase family M12A)